VNSGNRAINKNCRKSSDSIENRPTSFASTDEPGKREPEINLTQAFETGENTKGIHDATYDETDG
jgi:hypothetical protein